MVKLISNSDNKVMQNSSFVKNAVMYKDMFAFYDAYEKLVGSGADNMPNYCCYKDKSLCLEGICLFMKDYSSELGFESVKLTLDYLKVIYYTLAGYSKDGKNMPERSVIEKEFEQYIKASESSQKSLMKEFEEKNKVYKKSKGEFDKLMTNYSHKFVVSKVLDGLSVVLLILFLMSAMVTFSFYILNKLTLLVAVICSAALTVVAFVCFFLLKHVSKNIERVAGDFAYEIQTKKKNKNADFAELVKVKKKLSRIMSEKYEFNHNFSNEIGKYYKSVGFDALLAKAVEYKLLSYNKKMDIVNLFESQEEEIVETKNEIHLISNTASSSSDKLAAVYSKICTKDWLYYSNEVRFEFLKKFNAVSQKTHEWKLSVGNLLIDPFGMNLKKLSKEQVSYLKSKNDLFVSMSIDKLLTTNLIKSDRVLELETATDAENIYNLKMEYISHFYDYEKTKNYNNLFYGKTFNENTKVTDEIIENYSKIPSLVCMDLKQIESNIGLSNADSSAVKKISEIVGEYETTNQVKIDKVQVIAMREEVGSTVDITDFAQRLGDYGIEYHFGDTKFVGYKLGVV